MTWKPWPKDPRYLVSDQGEVKGLKGYTLSPGPAGYKGKYRKVESCQHGSMRVDHLVLETFVGPRPDNMECLHANDIQHDNRLENLSWGTHKENCAQRTANGKGTQRKHNYEEIKQAYLDGKSRDAIMKTFKVSYVQLWRILGRTRTYRSDSR